MIKQYLLRASVVLVFGVTGCQGLLDTTNPSLIRNEDITNPSGAEGRRASMRIWWQRAFLEQVRRSAMLSDEQSYDNGSIASYKHDEDWVTDLRDTALIQGLNPTNEFVLGRMTQGYWTTSLALYSIRSYAAEAVREDNLAEAYAFRGHLALLMAELMCPGFPINDVDADILPVYGRPLTTDSALQFAVTQFDSALVHGHDSTHFINLARVLKGRALTDLGQYAAAATAVQDVPDDFVYAPEYMGDGNPFYQERYNGDPSSQSYVMSDREGGNGLPYVSENDSIRTPYVLQGTRISNTDPIYVQNLFPENSTRIPVATGREAQLIRIEAAYQANDPSWFTQLNAMRTAVGLSAVPSIPATDTGKVNLIFHERAFWMFRTGHRLGDMRRLISRYGRNAETVFPTGAYPIFGLHYGTATSFPFSKTLQAQYNPYITQGCTGS